MKVFLSSPDSSSPTTTLEAAVVVSKVHQNIGLFKEKECSKELWNMPNVVLRYGSFIQKESRGTS